MVLRKICEIKEPKGLPIVKNSYICGICEICETTE